MSYNADFTADHTKDTKDVSEINSSEINMNGKRVPVASLNAALAHHMTLAKKPRITNGLHPQVVHTRDSTTGLHPASSNLSLPRNHFTDSNYNLHSNNQLTDENADLLPAAGDSSNFDSAHNMMQLIHGKHALRDDKILHSKLIDPKVADSSADLGLSSNTAAKDNPEVIVLSDSDDDTTDCTPLESKVRHLRKLQEKLRAEESKLMLLYSLRQNQTQQRQDANAVVVDASRLASASMERHTAQLSPSRGSQGLPPLTKKAAPPIPSTSLSVLSKSSSQTAVAHPALAEVKVTGLPGRPPPPLISTSQSRSSSTNDLNSRCSSSAPRQSTYTNLISPQKASVAQTALPSHISAEQKLSAAKHALRKQLEKTLLQIPLPKTPAPEMNFIPTINCGEFIYLIGMEEVVKYLLSGDQPEQPFSFTPFICVQCGSDFTAVWKRDKPGSKSVVCELCMKANQKKALKQEHTARLKAAFAKAVQYEQEIERRILAGSPLVNVPIVSQAVPPAKTPHTSLTSSTSLSQMALSAAALQPAPGAAQLKQQHQALQQAHNLEKMRAMLSAQTMTLPYQFYGFNSKQVPDLQRQYLLAMINPRRLWKT